jgi:hypothetical protein
MFSCSTQQFQFYLTSFLLVQHNSQPWQWRSETWICPNTVAWIHTFHWEHSLFVLLPLSRQWREPWDPTTWFTLLTAYVTPPPTCICFTFSRHSVALASRLPPQLLHFLGSSSKYSSTKWKPPYLAYLGYPILHMDGTWPHFWQRKHCRTAGTNVLTGQLNISQHYQVKSTSKSKHSKTDKLLLTATPQGLTHTRNLPLNCSTSTLRGTAITPLSGALLCKLKHIISRSPSQTMHTAQSLWEVDRNPILANKLISILAYCIHTSLSYSPSTLRPQMGMPKPQIYFF